jgi:hypothetical protein
MEEEDGEEDEKASGLFDELKDADAPGQKMKDKEEDFELVESDFDHLLHGQAGGRQLVW